MSAVVAILAGVTRVGTSAGSREEIHWIDENNGQNDLSKD
jgi:hypothetical protein